MAESGKMADKFYDFYSKRTTNLDKKSASDMFLATLPPPPEYHAARKEVLL